MAFYGLFERKSGTKSWKRVTTLKGSRESMARAAQGWLMTPGPGIERAIRRVD